MDEMVAAPTAISRKPWWVKVVDTPPMPMDLSVLKPGRTKALPPTTPAQDNLGPYIAYFQKQFPDWKPSGHWSDYRNGHTAQQFADIKWDALVSHPWMIPPPAMKPPYIMGMRPQGFREYASWKERGYSSRWQGTPEEALKICKVSAQLAGAADLGVIPVDDNFLRVMWGNNGTTQYEFGDVEDFVFTPNDIAPTKVVIPKTCKWYLHWTSRNPYWQANQYCATAGYEGIVSEHPYWVNTLQSIENFLWGLGYLSLSNVHGTYQPSGYAGVMAGSSELGRAGYAMSPKYGLGMRAMWGFLTDLPLAETKPIDAGMWKFCHNCGICAEECTFQSIPKGDPTWEAPSDYQYADRYNPGYLAWRNDTTKCHHCPVCMTVCPFSRNNPSDASIHDIVKATTANTSVFNGFFAKMERTMGGNKFKHPDLVWEADFEPMGVWSE